MYNNTGGIREKQGSGGLMDKVSLSCNLVIVGSNSAQTVTTIPQMTLVGSRSDLNRL